MKSIATRRQKWLHLVQISRIALLLAIAVLGTGEVCPVLANGGRSKVLRFDSRESGGIELSAEVQWELFSLNTAGNKYKVIHLVVRNNRSAPLILSSTDDAVEVYFGNKKVNGILDLARRDPVLWSTLEPKMRKLLIYPETIPPRQVRSVYIFIPKKTPADQLSNFRFKISSLSRDIDILPPPVAAS